MPIYEFETANGAIIEEFYHAGEAPTAGEMTTLSNGTRAKRIYSAVHGMVRRDISFVCRSAARQWMGKGPDPAPRRDAEGRPVIHSRREAVAFGKATGAEYDQL